MSAAGDLDRQIWLVVFRTHDALAGEHLGGGPLPPLPDTPQTSSGTTASHTNAADARVATGHFAFYADTGELLGGGVLGSGSPWSHDDIEALAGPTPAADR
jgi:hypothetical protein